MFVSIWMKISSKMVNLKPHLKAWKFTCAKNAHFYGIAFLGQICTWLLTFINMDSSMLVAKYWSNSERDGFNSLEREGHSKPNYYLPSFEHYLKIIIFFFKI